MHMRTYLKHNHPFRNPGIFYKEHAHLFMSLFNPAKSTRSFHKPSNLKKPRGAYGKA